MNEVFGTFILTRDGNGYTAEYFNNHLDNLIPENVIANQPGGNFVGTFTTNWTEGTNQFTSDLRIIQNGNIFNLIWTNVRNGNQLLNRMYIGRGVSRGNVLTSVYSEIAI